MKILTKFFLEIKSVFSEIFCKSKKKENKLLESGISKDENKNKVITKSEDLLKHERYLYLAELQKKIENDEVLYADVDLDDRDDLEKLYIEQINKLKRDIRSLEMKNSKL